MIQLDIFRDDDLITIKNDLKKEKDSKDRMRKALFAQNGEMRKEVKDIASRLEILEKNICNGTIKIVMIDQEQRGE